MTTTELIELLQKIEYGASGRPRVISLYIDDEFIGEPNIILFGTGDGCLGAEVELKIERMGKK